MAKTTLSILTVSILLSAAFFTSFAMMGSADALKAQGTPSNQGAKAYGSKGALKVCGDKLCRDVKKSTAVPATPATPATPAKPAEPAKPMTEKTDQTMSHTYAITSKTVTSVTDPGLGHESHQLVVILPPSEKIYKGSITFSASEPVQLVALTGPLAEGEDKGQPIWTPDGKTKFALTLVDPQASAGTWNFAGNALAIHTKNTTPFTVSYTVSASQ